MQADSHMRLKLNVPSQCPAPCTSPPSLSDQGNAIIDDTAKIGKDCVIGPNVAIGKL